MINTCIKCKYWHKITSGFPTGYCITVKVGGLEDSELDGFAVFGDGYCYKYCSLETGPNFGCIHWVEKTEVM